MTGTGYVCTVIGVTDVQADRPARRLRKEKGFTQEELADKVGCSQATIFDVETGRASPSLPLAIRLAAALGSTVDDLFADGAA